MEPTKAQTEAIFKKLQTERANQFCFDCQSGRPSWASIPLGIYICLDCSGIHRSLGVHISFVRSTTFDTWTWDQLRLMKVGGNQAAKLFFQQNGGSFMQSKDIRAKYSNNRAVDLWKERLKLLAENDKKMYPQCVMVETGSKQPLNEPESASTDFFESLKTSDEPTAVSDAMIFESSNSAMVVPPLTSVSASTLLPKKKGLGAKKLVNLDFEKSEQKAKELEQTLSVPPPSSSSSFSSSSSSSQPIPQTTMAPLPSISTPPPKAATSTVAAPQVSKEGMERLGMGRLPMMMQPVSNPTPSMVPAYAPPASPNLETQTRFAGAKSISSDQYFERGAYTPISSEDRHRLNQFSGVNAISSEAYFGREESNLVHSSSLEENAKEFAKKVATQTVQDLMSLKNVVTDAVTKFQSNFTEAQRNNYNNSNNNNNNNNGANSNSGNNSGYRYSGY